MNVMNGGTIVRVIAALLLVAVVIGLGAAVYNAGVSAGLTEAAQQAIASGDAAPVVPVYGYGYGPYIHGPFGWGFFGIFFWIFGFFLLFALLRAVFGWGRWGGRGPRGPNGWSGSHRAEEWHRELHRRNGEASGEGDQRPAGA
jgi:hypothetical protein